MQAFTNIPLEPPPMMLPPEQVPDYDATLRNKDFFPKIFLIPSEVRLDKCI